MNINQISKTNHEWLIEATIEDLQKAMDAQLITSKEIVFLYLKRIAEYDKSGPSINSVLEINPDAVHIAEALDYERKAKGSRGPLHGIPILLKDNIDTGDKMSTSAGSLALKDSISLKDAFLVSQLRKAGAVIIGKANLSEFANFLTFNMPNGYSSRGGQVLNPYGPGKFDVGGSSSGSAASIAANLAVASIGTETSGSILSPASQNSTVGIKPTLGLVSRSGVIPIAHSQDTAGPIARTITDAAILLGVLCSFDEEDPITFNKSKNHDCDYTKYLDKDGLKGARIGIPREYYYEELGKEKIDVINNVIKVLRDNGAEIIDPIYIPSFKEKNDYNVLIYEFKRDINAYLKKLDKSMSIHSLKDIIDFNNNHSEEALKYGQTILLESEKTSGTLTEPEYIESLVRNHYNSRENGIDFVMKEHKLDALLFPNNYGAGIAAKAGYPSITVPGGYTPQGEPVGATFTGMAYSESILIKLAYAFEQATKYRVTPKL